MSVLSGPALVVMTLLILAGIYKLVDPAPTSGALRLSGLPSARPMVRALGASEIVAAGAWLAFGGGLTAAVGAAFYGGFAIFVMNALARRLPISSCGCFGSVDTPPSKSHIVVNLLSAGVLVAVSIVPLGPLAGLTSEPLGEVIPLLAFAGAGVYLLYGVVAVLPLKVAAQRSTAIALTASPGSPR
ncbi:MAG: MauE/DoxX family redox-associated membrane protein [Acidimicrobiia bacterium]